MTTSRDHEQMHELISRRLDNDLSTAEMGLIEEHLRTCLSCRRLARDMEEAVSQLHASAPKTVAVPRRIEIEKELDRGGYLDARRPIGHRVAQYGSALAKMPGRLAWAFTSVLAIAGGGLALYSALVPERSPHRGQQEKTSDVQLEVRTLPQNTKAQRVLEDVHVEVRTVSQKTKAQRILENGGTIRTGDQIFLKVAAQPFASTRRRTPDTLAIYLSAMLVTGDGSRRMLSEQQEVFDGDEIGPFVITGASGEGRIILVGTSRRKPHYPLLYRCVDDPPDTWCQIVRFKQDSSLTPGPVPPEMQ